MFLSYCRFGQVSLQMNIALQHSMSRTDDVGFRKNLERNRLMAFKYILYCRIGIHLAPMNIEKIRRHKAFKEVAIIRHPCIGEDAFGFITSSVTLRNYAGDEELCCFYVLTNHR
ncbi:Protein LIKE COV 1 [Linum grandiflorum]